MKLAAFIFVLPALAFGCQFTPLKNIRHMYSLEDLQRFHEERNVKGFMINHTIYHDDIEVFTLFFTYGKSKRITYQEPLLSQTDCPHGQEVVYFHPLHLAAQVGAVKITGFCLEHKADVNNATSSNATQFNCNTPAHIAVAFGKHEVLKMLLGHGGFDFNSKNGEGKTIEDIAREKNDSVALSIIHDLNNKKIN